MFSQGHSEHLLLAAALLVIVAFGVCYMVPGLLGAFSYITTTFFLCAGMGVLVLGFFQLYHTHKNGY